MSLIKQRQGKFLGYQSIRGLDGVMRIEPIFEKRKFSEMTIAKTLNTDVTCRVCMGQGFFTGCSVNSGLFDQICGHCNGSGKMKSV